jgi:hypothetical protein
MRGAARGDALNVCHDIWRGCSARGLLADLGGAGERASTVAAPGAAALAFRPGLAQRQELTPDCGFADGGGDADTPRVRGAADCPPPGARAGRGDVAPAVAGDLRPALLGLAFEFEIVADGTEGRIAFADRLAARSDWPANSAPK